MFVKRKTGVTRVCKVEDRTAAWTSVTCFCKVEDRGAAWTGVTCFCKVEDRGADWTGVTCVLLCEVEDMLPVFVRWKTAELSGQVTHVCKVEDRSYLCL